MKVINNLKHSYLALTFASITRLQAAPVGCSGWIPPRLWARSIPICSPNARQSTLARWFPAKTRQLLSLPMMPQWSIPASSRPWWAPLSIRRNRERHYSRRRCPFPLIWWPLPLANWFPARWGRTPVSGLRKPSWMPAPRSFPKQLPC